MRSSHLVEIITAKKIDDLEDFEISDLLSNSKNILNNSVFFCLVGNSFDGHSFAEAALNAGARLIIAERDLGLKNQIIVDNTREAYAKGVAAFYGDPAKKLKVFGVTGTNGKTTINYLLYSALEKLGSDVLSIGTLGIKSKLHDQESLTTPDVKDLQKAMSEALSSGISYTVMEVSSHGLAQSRVSGIDFDCAIFTNLTRDHLDFHKDLASYFAAKKLLFLHLANSSKEKLAVVCTESEYGKKMAEYCRSLELPLLTYGSSDASAIISNFKQFDSGASFDLTYQNQILKIKTKLSGYHNALNLSAVLLALSGKGIALEKCLAVLAELKQAPGRFEVVHEKPRIIVDYAHTPDAIQNVLSAARKITKNKLWVIFGCGGDRDKGKRPAMARISAELADNVVVTSDNPRTEDPQQIIQDILASGISTKIVEVDRKKAIFKTLAEMADEDLLMILGKGHEDYQIIGKEKFHFSDAEIVQEFYKKQYVDQPN